MSTNSHEAKAPAVASKKRKSDRRRRTELLQVRVSEDELRTIMDHAASCGITSAEYLRRLGTGYTPASKLDQITVRDLCKVAADMGRLGGLLKLWISVKRGEETSNRDSIDIKSIDGLWRDINITYQDVKSKVGEL
jgi:hypothetical protein